MTDLIKNIRAFQFNEGIDRIRTAYRASRDAMDEAYVRASQEMELYGGTSEEIFDYSGNLKGSADWHFQAKLDTTEHAITIVCEAFITSIFHYWEVQARGWTQQREKGSNFEILKAKVSTMYKVHPDLSGLNALNNLLKHDNPKRFDDLFKLRGNHYFKRPLFFRRTPISVYVGIPVEGTAKSDEDTIGGQTLSHGKSRSSLAINNFHVEEAFDIVAASGPTAEE